jgi:hypothetical protein
MDFEALDEAWRQEWSLSALEELVKLEKASYKALLKVHENSATCDGCEPCDGCAQNHHITQRLLSAEGEVRRVYQKNHDTLREVYRNSDREQRARAERKLPGCESCCANESISRRCMSPCMDGPPVDVMDWHDDVHAIEVGEEGVAFCTECRGMDIGVRHQPNRALWPWASLHAQ